MLKTMVIRCKHTKWIQVSQEELGTVVTQTDRLRTVVESLYAPAKQHPALVLALQRTANPPLASLLTSVSPGSVHLAIDPESAHSPRPLFVLQAFTDVKPSRSKHRAFKCCTTLGEISFTGDSELHLARYLAPFVDVLYFRYQNAIDFDYITKQCIAWDKKKALTDEQRIGPEIIVVDTCSGDPSGLRRRLLNSLSSLLESSAPTFLGVSVASDTCSFQSVVKPAIQRAERRKREGQTLFSAMHLVPLMEESLSLTTEQQPFSLVRILFPPRLDTKDLSQHLQNFLGQVQTIRRTDEFAAESIASSLVLDHHRPDMHGTELGSGTNLKVMCLLTPVWAEFLTRDVFDALYKHHVITAIAAQNQGVTIPQGALDLAPSSIIDYMSSLRATPRISRGRCVRTHLNTTKRHKLIWAKIKCQKTCLLCLTRTPEHKLPCSHLLCDNCARLVGKQSEKDPCSTTILCCPLCHKLCRVAIYAHPLTAGVGVLCLDGGGVRGIVETMLLARLEKRLQAVAGICAPIQTHFRLAVGTSAGGLNLLALFSKGWRAVDCSREYERLATTAFKPKIWNRLPLISTLWMLWNNGRYSSKLFESVLRATFGSETTMLDSSYAQSIGARIAIPVARSPDPSLLLLTSYNGAGDSTVRVGKSILPGYLNAL